MARVSFMLVMLSLAAGMARLLGAIGLYGVIGYSASQRTHEIGIRMALGAQMEYILRLMLGQGTKLAFIGVAIGIAAALGLSRFLSSLLYGVKPTDPLTFFGVTIVLVLVTLTTRHKIVVETDLAQELSPVFGDRVQLQQVMMNLMMNSIDAMKDVESNRVLTIKSQRADDGTILITVSDTGVGLPQEQKDEIFNAFFTTKSHGTGMGLSISRSIVESHGGRLWASGNSPRGASFCLTLPANIEANE